jgi:type IV secretion system protein VirB11
MSKDIILKEFEQCLDQGIIPKFEEEFLDKNKYLKNILTLNFLESQISDSQTREVIIHRNNHMEIIHNNGKSFISPQFELNELYLCMKYYTLKYHQSWNYTQPFCSFKVQLFNHPIRLSFIHHSSGAEKMFIRKLSQNQFTLIDFKVKSTDFFQTAIDQKSNILVSGSTGSGKTSFISALLNDVSQDEHIIIMEDTDEISTSNPNHTKLLSKEGVNSLEEYCSYSMRMSPDRIILGEIRSKEVTPFLLNLNSGCSGAFASIHANNAIQAVDRMALLYNVYNDKYIPDEVVKKLICQNINYIIHLEHREIIEVLKILGFDKGRILYERINFQENPNMNINLF